MNSTNLENLVKTGQLKVEPHNEHEQDVKCIAVSVATSRSGEAIADFLKTVYKTKNSPPAP